MASFATLLVILSVSCAAEIKGISKRADTKNNVCDENSKGLSFLQTEGLLNLHQKSAILRSQGTGGEKYDYFIGICTNPNPQLVSDDKCMVIQMNSTDPSKSTGTCLGRKDEAQLTDTLSLGWIELTYSNGAAYNSHCDGNRRVSRIFFFCDSTAGDGTPEFIEENRDDNYCYYLFNWPTSHICPRPSTVLPTVDPGWYLIIIMIILAFLWGVAMLVGILLKRFVLGAKGWEQIPFLRWYQLFGELEVDGCNLVCRCNRGREKPVPMTTIGKQPLPDAEAPESESESETEHKDEDLIPM